MPERDVLDDERSCLCDIWECIWIVDAVTYSAINKGNYNKLIPNLEVLPLEEE